MEFDVEPKIAVPLASLYWFRLTKLECNASAIEPIFPVKSFQKLCVKGIKSVGTNLIFFKNQ